MTSDTAEGTMTNPSVAEVEDTGNPVASFFDDILKPGSSLQPAFLAILDGAFALLLFILFGLAILTSWNLHVIALMFVEMGLWGSVKWFTNELKKMPSPPSVENKKDE